MMRNTLIERRKAQYIKSSLYIRSFLRINGIAIVKMRNYGQRQEARRNAELQRIADALGDD